MSRRLSLLQVVAVVNGGGFVGYLLWLAGRGRRVFFDPQGVIYLLPCVAFLFVFACLVNRASPARGPRRRSGGTSGGAVAEVASDRPKSET